MASLRSSFCRRRCGDNGATLLLLENLQVLKKPMIPVLAAICALVGFGFAIVYTHKILTKSSSTPSAMSQVTYNNTVLTAIGLGFIMASDIIVACAMLYHLSRNKSEFPSTNKALNTLITYSVSSGALTTVFTVGELVAEATSPSTLYEAPFAFIRIRLHCLSFMSILNSRDHVRSQLHADDHTMITIPSSDCMTTDLERGTNSVAETKTRESRAITFANAGGVGTLDGK
ncbi:hypothetical protein R3P38DRAFT_804484 [Favolaschia claudopus]|uniref:DUF6534 domain-containing protein n=1 Tax=Favolaschia claudopus TaxID=2862362 RepID=A0AAV9Z1Z7_9AGAR